MNVYYIINPYFKGLNLGMYLYLFAHILDHTLCKSDMFNLIKKDPILFNQCATSNFINLIVLAPLYYIFSDIFLLSNNDTNIQYLNIIYILLVHNFLFYIAHYSFHNIKSLYFIHSFHHKFYHPIPSSGNAVSVTEYNIAYVLPFLIPAYFIKPNEISFRISISIIGILNALIHSIPLYNFKINKFLIKPGDHIEHHQKLTVKYAAPLLNIDYILSYFNKQ